MINKIPNMATDEDNELRDLVAQTLENNGVLNKIRAELRAGVFLALEEQSTNEAKIQLVSKEFKDYVSTNDGRIIVCLIREFLDFFNLEFTESVFSPETGENKEYTYDGRLSLSSDLNIDSPENNNGPLLGEVLRRSQVGSNENLKIVLSEDNLKRAKAKFEVYDEDDDGKINSHASIDLFMDLFPNFKRSLVEKFMEDEYHAMGLEKHEGITLEDFNRLYQKLFSLCQSVVTQNPSVRIASYSDSKIDNRNNTTYTHSPRDDEDKQRLVFNNESLVPTALMAHDDNSGTDDSFYDEPQNIYKRSTAKKDHTSSSRIAAGGYLGSLPPLVTSRQDTEKMLPLEMAKLDQDFNSKLADFELDNSHNDDYDEDFQSSEHKSGSEVSIGEEIEEDTSNCFNDLLSTASGLSLPGNENITTDKTVSQVSPNDADYLESFKQDSNLGKQ